MIGRVAKLMQNVFSYSRSSTVEQVYKIIYEHYIFLSLGLNHVYSNMAPHGEEMPQTSKQQDCEVS